MSAVSLQFTHLAGPPTNQQHLPSHPFSSRGLTARPHSAATLVSRWTNFNRTGKLNTHINIYFERKLPATTRKSPPQTEHNEPSQRRPQVYMLQSLLTKVKTKHTHIHITQYKNLPRVCIGNKETNNHFLTLTIKKERKKTHFPSNPTRTSLYITSYMYHLTLNDWDGGYIPLSHSFLF